MPYAGFSGPIPSVNKTVVAYPGSFKFRFGKRKPQSYDYSPRYPVLHYNRRSKFSTAVISGICARRATRSRAPDSEQAQGPPLDTQEMGNPDFGWRRVSTLAGQSTDRSSRVSGQAIIRYRFPQKTLRRSAGLLPARLAPIPRHSVSTDKSGTASATFDCVRTFHQRRSRMGQKSPRSVEIRRPSWQGSATLSPDEMARLNLFRGKGNCNSCHLDGRSTASFKPQLAPNGGRYRRGGRSGAAVHRHDLVQPRPAKNQWIPYLFEDKPDSFGFTAESAGFGFTDLGVGLFLRGMSGVNPGRDLTQFAPQFDGFMQVATARDVGLRRASPELRQSVYAQRLPEEPEGGRALLPTTRDKPGFAFNVTVGNLSTR